MYAIRSYYAAHDDLLAREAHVDDDVIELALVLVLVWRLDGHPTADDVAIE